MLIRVFIQKLAGLIAFLLLASVLIFLIVDVLPGDPAALMLGTDARPDTLQALRHQLGLDQPLVVQYASWIIGLLHFDFGTSMTYATPVLTLIAERLPVSLPLAMLSLALTVVIAIPLGALSAHHHGSTLDRVIKNGLQLALALPNIWLALLLIMIFAVGLHWLPAGGFAGWKSGIMALKSLLLPLLALAIPQAAILARIVRAEIRDKAQENFVSGARARGLSEKDILWHHILPNAMLPVLSVIGLQFAFLIAGTVIIETVFSLPGLGRLIFQSITQRDLPVIKGVAMLLVGSVILVNQAVDLLATLIDPRLRRQSGGSA
jgi:peptide/nickel transport system permease protein